MWTRVMPMRFGAPHLDIDPAMLGERLVVLGNLVALGRVGIKVVLAREARTRVDGAIERQRRLHRHRHSFAIEHRKRARQPQANRTGVRVRRIAEARRARAEDLRLSEELDVHFQSDHRLVSDAPALTGMDHFSFGSSTFATAFEFHYTQSFTGVGALT
jgi:hypothetical protein